jgi:hypothetical protein
MLVLSPSDFEIEICSRQAAANCRLAARAPQNQIDPGCRAVRHYDGCGLFFNNATADTNTSKPPNVQTMAAPDGKSL